MKTVFKETLKNGLTVLVKPRNSLPRVSTQLWYSVGSKDEKVGEKGLAHLIEHMIFKGTGTLSECDINLIVSKLSGYCNAFTSYDYTCYLFDFPSQHWFECLPILADCMRNCTFKQEFLNSELKAVIQELKMYKDNYTSSIIENLISSAFPDHPYHHPIIGYKQDLWSLERQALLNFYNRHYMPNNGTLVVVGDVKPQEVFDYAHKYFGNLPQNLDYKKESFYHSPDLKNNSIELYRDVKQPILVCSWILPGSTTGQDYLFDLLALILASGRGSRLYKKLVNDLELAADLTAFNDSLEDYSILFFYAQPKDTNSIDAIIAHVKKEVEDIVNNLTDAEIERAIKKTEVEYLANLEDNQKQAYAIGKYYLSTGDEHFFDNYINYPKTDLSKKLKDLISRYLKPELMNTGKVLPLKEKEKDYWLELQEISDEEDARILKNKVRTSEVEEGRCVHLIEIKEPKPFKYPKAQSIDLDNGLKVLYFNNNEFKKIDLVIDFKDKYFYDPENLQGLTNFLFNMLEEGTANYSADEFATVLEAYGMTLITEPGRISLSMLAKDFNKGLELLNEILTKAAFSENSIERVRSRMLNDLDQFWDTPKQFVRQIIRENIYKGHPYSKNALGTKESIQKITKSDLLEAYKKFISPKAAKMAVVGYLEDRDIKKDLESILKNWQGSELATIEWPKIKPVHKEDINYKIMRDQVFLAYAGLSVDRMDPDYNKLLIFDQTFGGGSLGSMSSKLFDLREKSGLFYTISGSLLDNTGKQPGLITVRTIVSNDRLKEAEGAISNVINNAINTLTEDEFKEAKRTIINSLVDNFESNIKTAHAFLFIDNYNFPLDYFDKKAEEINKIEMPEVVSAVKKYLNTDRFIKVRAGRV